MVFLDVPAVRLKVSIWETRVKDFAEFVAQTGFDATAGMYSPGRDGWKQRGHTWFYPGLAQTLDSPICGINSFDAIAFCEWLTNRERQRGIISGIQQYRLPTTEEWLSYAGNRRFPWGNAHPPRSPEGWPLANVGGEDIRDGNWPDTGFTIQGYKDGYPRSSPVGSFPPNELGCFDTGGNIKEWSSDWYPEGKAAPDTDSKIETSSTSQLRVLLGSGWATALVDQLGSHKTGAVRADDRVAGFGFRIVLAESNR